MFKTALLCAAACGLSGTAHASLIISEVVDGDLSGGNPKFVEITNTGGSNFTFTSGGIILQSNAATDLDIDVDLTGVTINAGDSYVIQSSANGGQALFESTYGFAADLYTTAFFSNGDDRYILNVDGVIADIHGQIDTDGTGTSWEYTDSYSYRLASVTTGTGSTFVESGWFNPGLAALDTLDAAGHAAVTTPGTHVFVPEPGSLALLGLGGLLVARRRRA